MTPCAYLCPAGRQRERRFGLWLTYVDVRDVQLYHKIKHAEHGPLHESVESAMAICFG